MIEVDILTPVRQLVRGAKADSVKLPASKGEIQVLPGHIDLITALGTGVISFVSDGRERKFAVTHGFAEIRGDKVVVLGEVVEEAREIDRERAARARKKAEEVLSGVMSREEFAKYERKLQRAIVRQRTTQ